LIESNECFVRYALCRSTAVLSTITAIGTHFYLYQLYFLHTKIIYTVFTFVHYFYKFMRNEK
jgi:hypothetical protein